MRPAPLLGLLLLSCCAAPPRVDDKTAPKAAFETFRGAIARGEYDREWACLSDRLRQALGLGSRADWADARVTLLGQNHRLIKGIVRAKLVGRPASQPDGRVLLQLDLPFGYRGRVWMAPVAVLRIRTAGSRADVYAHLDGLQVVASRTAAGVAIPPDVADDLRAELSGKRVTSFVARVEWFLDEFAAGDDTPGSIRRDLERAE